ncbi:hypothetical protein AAG607_07425 [Citromicrobium bathyomarinum]|uniref:hypothetical protein n=1 Tax=Alphaproteobacteria TaxID=28211 RepID=UPI000C0D593F|nr:hypothetical protein [Henriciella sp.]PHR73737.1 MAG: hypothetical protein COA64_14635 [Henriciella sp.]
MTASPIVDAVISRLRAANYKELGTPLRVAGVEFPFTAAMRGSDGRALDLVLVFDTTTGDFGDTDSTRIRQRVEALSRALDVTGSRYVVTAILVGATLASGIDALAETCRVLQVDAVPLDGSGQPNGEVATMQLDDQIRVLLPLTLPPAVALVEGSGGPALDQLAAALGKNVDAIVLESLIAAAAEGEDEVITAIGTLIDETFESDDMTEKERP